jgi:predicted FMN-binding regulatory protein PaiB
MPRLTKYHRQVKEAMESELKHRLEHPPWNYKDTDPDYYHRSEYKDIKSLRMEIETLAYRLKVHRSHYDLSAVIIPESIQLQLTSVADAIHEEQLTRDMSGKPTERSFIALKAKEAKEAQEVQVS